MKKGWIIALVLLLIGAFGAYVWYSRLKNETAAEKGPYDNTLRPRLELAAVDITNISKDTTDLTVRLLIDNPLPIGFEARRLRYTVFMANTPIVESSYDKPINVRSGDSTFVVLPMQLLNKKMMTVLETLDRKNVDSTTYGVRATFDLDVPILGERTFTQTLNQRLPTFYLPELTIADIDFGHVGLKRTDVAAKMNVVNQNRFPFNFTDTHYVVSIDGKEIAEGDQPEPILIKARSTTPVVLPVTVKAGQALALAPKMLFDKKDTPYEVRFRCKIVSKDDNPSFKNSQLKTRIRGTLADLKELKNMKK